jgi:signal transduction histidine kinase
MILDEHLVARKFYAFNLALIFVMANNLLLATAIYKLLGQKRDWVYWSLLIFTIPAFFINLWQYAWGWHIGADTMAILTPLIIARVAIINVRKRKKGAWLLAGGAICCLLLFIFFTATRLLKPDLLLLTNLFYVFSGLSIPVATSVYLGLDFGFISNSLMQKLKEVNELSQKNIEQEREKQQILSAQNELLEQQVVARTAEVVHQKEELQSTLSDLKSTQSQLIQSEKMASLGELTAGIAHEIQNPLNFVNNFSDVNKELLMELKEEANKGNIDEVNAIADDIIGNEEKINHHGKRADAIVKGMLQHSRSSSATKEPTDINKLADEYLRLAYHGLRAKDNAFNAILKTDFDATIGNINIIPQDIGRVILNLITNAFYAVDEKKKSGVGNYEPTVTVSTKKSGNKVLIGAADNGNGIPQKILDKIFQPFFTTKPTGQGTGLGLSLSYDIVKAHGGELKVETKEGEGSEFIIQLPVV